MDYFVEFVCEPVSLSLSPGTLDGNYLAAGLRDYLLVCCFDIEIGDELGNTPCAHARAVHCVLAV